jgi:hypothetical protein
MTWDSIAVQMALASDRNKFGVSSDHGLRYKDLVDRVPINLKGMTLLIFSLDL